VSESTEPQAPSERDGIEWVMDRLVYGPYGALTEMTLNPTEAAEAGRRRLEQQLRNARFLGEMTVSHGTRELKRRVSDLFGASSSPRSSYDGSEPTPARAAQPTTKMPRPQPIDHVLEGYDDLSASQVVKLLDSLSTDELETLRAYEQALRGRRTIINRASQLLERA